MVAAQAQKRVGLRFVPSRVVTWDHRKLGGTLLMDELKGLILSGGKGTRLRPLTHTSAKQLVPVANKPVLFYGHRGDGRRPGIDEVGIIVAPETGGEIRDGGGRRLATSASQIEYIEQDAPHRPRARGAHGRAVPRLRRRS